MATNKLYSVDWLNDDVLTKETTNQILNIVEQKSIASFIVNEVLAPKSGGIEFYVDDGKLNVVQNYVPGTGAKLETSQLTKKLFRYTFSGAIREGVDMAGLENGLEVSEVSRIINKAKMTIINTTNKIVLGELLKLDATNGVNVISLPTNGLSKDNVYEFILELSKELDILDIPQEGRRLLLSPQAYTWLKQNAILTAYDSELKKELRHTGIIGEVNGIPTVQINWLGSKTEDLKWQGIDTSGVINNYSIGKTTIPDIILLNANDNILLNHWTVPPTAQPVNGSGRIGEVDVVARWETGLAVKKPSAIIYGTTGGTALTVVATPLTEVIDQYKTAVEKVGSDGLTTLLSKKTDKIT